MKTKKKAVSLERKMAVHGYVFALPLIVGFLVIFLGVIIDSVVFSFGELDITGAIYAIENVGWNNYNYALFVDPDFVRALVNSVIKMLVDIPVILFFSLFIATLLNQKMKSKGFFRLMFFIPVIIATGIIAQADLHNHMFNLASSGQGIDTGTAGSTGTTLAGLAGIGQYFRNLTFSPQITEFVVAAVDNIYEVINRSGVPILLFLAGLQSISPSIYEAAKVEGATGWEEFWLITLPMISPIILVNTVYTVVDSFIRPENSVMGIIYRMGFVRTEYGRASAMAWLYFLVIIVIVALAGLIVSRMVYYEKRD